jgi:hypothetical protein
VRICAACGCPASVDPTRCGWCGAALQASSSVSFVLERTPDGFSWNHEGTLVAEAATVHGVWQIQDSRRRRVVTLMPLAPTAGEVSPESKGELALIGPTARLIGTIDRVEAVWGRADATARDGAGHRVLVMRGDGPTGGHIVDRSGEIVAIASWDEQHRHTDLLVTAKGARQPLSFVFGLVLAIELDRQAGRPV